MNLTQKLLAFTLLGAEWVLWLLIFLSVISLAIAIERGLYYFSLRATLGRWPMTCGSCCLTTASSKRASGRSPKRVWKQKSPVPVWLTRSAGPMRRKRRCWGPRLGSSCGSSATSPSSVRWAAPPFIGLFGTVLGIIKAFRDLAANQSGGIAIVMAGISEALVATAVGLLVAIPAVVFYNFYNRQVRAISSHIDSVSQVIFFSAALRAESTHPATPPAAKSGDSAKAAEAS